MRKRIVKSLGTISAIVCVAITVSLMLLEKYWIAKHGAETLMQIEYIFCVLVIVVLVLVVVFPLSLMLANSIIRPLERSEDDYVELSHLKRRIDAQSSQLLYSSSELEEKERNLSLVVENMSEGLILLDRKGMIMMMNSSACTILGAERDKFIGKHIYTVNSALSIQASVNEAMGGKSSHDELEIMGSTIELSINPVLVEKIIRGAVVFLRDVTESQAAEKMRREFSANVSHELRTPLTSISGYAELLKEGMATEGDVLPFATKIYDEAQRLIYLTEDIMRLSRLDEGATTLSLEEIELLPVVESVAERLQIKAEEHNVSLKVSGSGGKIMGNAFLLDEMVYNLCDNAIKYNRADGSVEISVGQTGDDVVLSVSDTGVGIPREHQDRVFERFYRVDKSHSKATGGTGLGLSIVKNGTAFHNARVELNSNAGVGTTISLLFAKV